MNLIEKVLVLSHRLPPQFCDGLNRRSFLRAGGMAMGGLTLPELLRAQGENRHRLGHKACIMIFLAGGPPHQDMFDLKPEAPSEIRGEFSPISTNLPGVQICEHLPQLASRMDRYSLIRSIYGAKDRHDAFQCLTGRLNENQPVGGWPSLGSVISKIRGTAKRGIPPFISLNPKMKVSGWSNPGDAGFLGKSHSPFTPNADGAANLDLHGIDVSQFQSRTALLADLDRMKRQVDKIVEFEGVDAFTEQALGILTSSKLSDALDITKEDPKLVERYGGGSYEYAGYGDGACLHNDYFIKARRLVEAGVRTVTVAYGRWDWHGQPHGTNFENARDHLPFFDQGVSALIDDIYQRGLDRDVSVVVWGEFGRTPRINAKGGRDHWPRASFALMFGGGVQPGRVIGATNKFAEEPSERPVHIQEVFATLYHNLGIDTETATVNDLSGRPRYLVDHTKYGKIDELV
ncbi:DUF1501 domain-containing protein [Pirellulaceae bacterium]|nr:DUF1501 domain-containing protein [Pirellulaceae bacterium]